MQPLSFMHHSGKAAAEGGKERATGNCKSFESGERIAEASATFLPSHLAHAPCSLPGAAAPNTIGGTSSGIPASVLALMANRAATTASAGAAKSDIERAIAEARGVAR